MTEDEIDVIVADVLDRSQRLQPSNCCLGPEWRGRLCQYHEGVEDGADAALRRLEHQR